MDPSSVLSKAIALGRRLRLFSLAAQGHSVHVYSCLLLELCRGVTRVRLSDWDAGFLAPSLSVLPSDNTSSPRMLVRSKV